MLLYSLFKIQKNTDYRKRMLNKPQKTPINKKVMEHWYYIATYFIALVAVAGFVLSIVTSRRTTKTSEQLVNSLASFVEPVLKFATINFIPSPKFLDCQNAPQLINYVYRNVSNIPIKVELKSIESFYGDVPIYTGPRSKVDNKPKILAPGEIWGVVTQSIDKSVQEKMKGKQNMFLSPFIRVELKATISNIGDEKRYDIFLIHQIGVDCQNYQSGYNVTTVLESYVKDTNNSTH